MASLSERLAETNGKPAGFDYMRIVLATLIVVWHTSVICYGNATMRAFSLGYSRPLWAALLPMFFALSGFLVSGSLERCRTLVSFLGLRLIRLLPALAVESLLAMIVIGPLFTNLPLHAYFHNRAFFAYLLNIVGDIHFNLPGVFQQNPDGSVNGQLWSLPAELKCYMIISVVAVIGAYRVKALTILTCVLAQAYVSYKMSDPAFNAGYGVTPSCIFILAFVWGVFLYRFRESVPFSKILFLASAIGSVVFLNFHATESIASLPVAYMTVYLGLLNPKRNPVVSSGDYSYGIYLYGYPIQQAVQTAFPNAQTWWFNLLLSIPIVYGLAYLSWHVVEKRALKLRPMLKQVEQMWIPFSDALSGACEKCLPAGLRVRWAPRRATV